jgi:hypothetical protein
MTLATIQTAALSIAGFIFTALIGFNLRRLAAELGWDGLFTWAWKAAPAGMRNILLGWNPLRQLWWLWLSLGLSSGPGISLWLIKPAETPVVIVSASALQQKSPILGLDDAKR